MFDLAWSEIAVIVVVAVVVIGPKDLPDTIRTVAKGIGKLRRMAGELQGHLDEVVREAKLEDVRDQIRDIRNFDIKGEIQRTVDADGSLKKTFEEDPFRDDPFRAKPPTPSADAAPAAPAIAVAEGTEAAGTDAAAVAGDPDPARAAAPPPEGGRAAMGLDPLAPSAAVPPAPSAPVVPAAPEPVGAGGVRTADASSGAASHADGTAPGEPPRDRAAPDGAKDVGATPDRVAPEGARHAGAVPVQAAPLPPLPVEAPPASPAPAVPAAAPPAGTVARNPATTPNDIHTA